MRRLFLWLAVASLAGLTFVSAAQIFAVRLATGWWTYYVTLPLGTPKVYYVVFDVIHTLQATLFPIATISAAAYMVLADRELQARARPNDGPAFEVRPMPPAEDAN